MLKYLLYKFGEVKLFWWWLTSWKFMSKMKNAPSLWILDQMRIGETGKKGEVPKMPKFQGA